MITVNPPVASGVEEKIQTCNSKFSTKSQYFVQIRFADRNLDFVLGSVVRADPEHRIASNDQWTNVAADLRGYDDMSTVDRRHRELHTTSVGGIVGSGGGGRPQSRATDSGFRNEFHLCDNNSHKIKMQGDESAREMFHKHMSSTVLGSKGQPITEIHEQDMSWGTADLFVFK